MCFASFVSRLPATILVVLVTSTTVAAVPPRLAVLRSQRTRLNEQFGTKLETLARECDKRDLSEGASTVRRAAGSPADNTFRFESLPSGMQPPIASDLPVDEKFWRNELRRLRTDHAKALYLLTRRVLNAGLPSYAYELVREVARIDPDHAAGRRLLGFVRFQDEWLTPYAASQRRLRRVLHDRYGWLPATHVARYEKGQRYFKRRWISATRERELRRDFRNAWRVRTDHYLVLTNHSLERGVQVGRALETYHGFFRQTFAAFFRSPKQLQRLFDGAATSRRRAVAPKPFVVHYYSTRGEYIQTLKPRIDQIGITNGLYMPDDRVAYFYHDPEADGERTLYHEATHQLFFESTSRPRPIALNTNFWIIEGIACYMESFRPTDKGLSIGDPTYVRFHWARHRWLKEGYYVPLPRFTRIGMRAFQNDPNIVSNYSQASGLAHFFMHFDNGRYRDALVEHLAQLYSADRRAAVKSLESLTGVAFDELDRQYRRYLSDQANSLPVQPDSDPDSPSRRTRPRR